MTKPSVRFGALAMSGHYKQIKATEGPKSSWLDHEQVGF
jgi:hypothetical protein